MHYKNYIFVDFVAYQTGQKSYKTPIYIYKILNSVAVFSFFGPKLISWKTRLMLKNNEYITNV